MSAENRELGRPYHIYALAKEEVVCGRGSMQTEAARDLVLNVKQKGAEFVFGQDSICEACPVNTTGEFYDQEQEKEHCEPGSLELLALDEQAVAMMRRELGSQGDLINESGLTVEGVRSLFAGQSLPHPSRR